MFHPTTHHGSFRGPTIFAGTKPNQRCQSTDKTVGWDVKDQPPTSHLERRFSQTETPNHRTINRNKTSTQVQQSSRKKTKKNLQKCEIKNSCSTATAIQRKTGPHETLHIDVEETKKKTKITKQISAFFFTAESTSTIRTEYLSEFSDQLTEQAEHTNKQALTNKWFRFPVLTLPP